MLGMGGYLVFVFKWEVFVVKKCRDGSVCLLVVSN